MVKGRLPADGPVAYGQVTLPPGRLITSYLSRKAVAWATVDPVPESALAWAGLADLHPETGLVPVQLDDVDFTSPEDPREAAALDAAVLLADLWNDWVRWPQDANDPEAIGRRAPFSLDFPGLAPPGGVPLTPVERAAALGAVLPGIRQAAGLAPTARIGLVAADRPADVLPLIGWGGLIGRGLSLLPLTAVLRSWEDRFGARLIDASADAIRLLVDRPPRTLEAAQRVAAEHVVIADECMGAFSVVPGIAASLVNAPIWTFWWD